MSNLLVPLSASEATDASRFGPKAANLAALGRARLPIPDGVCLDAEAEMAVLIQPLVHARASGGGLSRTANGERLISATWGLGSAIAQGEVTPDRFEFDLDGALLRTAVGQKDHTVACAHRRAPTT